MNGHWTAATLLTECGYGSGHAVKVDDPVYELASGHARCEAHAPAHALEDTAAIERVCLAVEARRHALTTPIDDESQAVDRAAVATTTDRTHAHATTPVAPVVHDPKALAYKD